MIKHNFITIPISITKSLKHKKITPFIKFPHFHHSNIQPYLCKFLATHVMTFKTNLKHSQYYLKHQAQLNLIKFSNPS